MRKKKENFTIRMNMKQALWKMQDNNEKLGTLLSEVLCQEWVLELKCVVYVFSSNTLDGTKVTSSKSTSLYQNRIFYDNHRLLGIFVQG